MADDPKHRIIALTNIVDGATLDRSQVEVRGIACGIVERDGTGLHGEEYAGFLRDVGYQEYFLFFYGASAGSLPLDVAMLRASAEARRPIALQGTLLLRASDAKYELRVSGLSFVGYESLGFGRKA